MLRFFTELSVPPVRSLASFYFFPLLSARSSSLPARRLAALCLLFSHTKPPGTALGRSPAQFFCAGCILFLLPLASLAPSLPKPPSQPMRYLPPPSPTSPSQPLPPDPFLHQGDSSGGGNGKKIVRLLRLLDVCDVCVSGCVQDYVCHPPSQVF